ncbi:hypothetical protein H072_6660 [Dactylellina haptotyla CBS 200.50]|uniref:Uncharacterized protein n=1 Tax=Dactylellina haptotyla (strain CBS 200.50) TaxID=1284197 RepID=S8BJM7_DACHA|nr:hypothetical protein H072_6660 [Dactylellina haptotyla CBS 200.50]
MCGVNTFFYLFLLTLLTLSNAAIIPFNIDTDLECDHCGGPPPPRRDLTDDTDILNAPKNPTIDVAKTPAPSRDNCFHQLEQYGVYADDRCEGYGEPMELINSYRGGPMAQA